VRGERLEVAHARLMFRDIRLRERPALEPELGILLQDLDETVRVR
jgi:hypothetical protein